MSSWAKVTREWRIEVASSHTVRAELDMLSGIIALLLDDQEIFRRTRHFWDAAYEHRFAVDGTQCLLRILAGTWNAEYELWVGDKLQQG